MLKKSKDFVLSPPVILLTIFFAASILWHHVKNTLEVITLKEMVVKQTLLIEPPLWEIIKKLESYQIVALTCVKEPSEQKINAVKLKTGELLWISSCVPQGDLVADVQFVQSEQLQWSVKMGEGASEKRVKDLFQKEASLAHLESVLKSLKEQMDYTEAPSATETGGVQQVSRHWFVNESGSVSVKVKIPKNGAEK